MNFIDQLEFPEVLTPDLVQNLKNYAWELATLIGESEPNRYRTSVEALREAAALIQKHKKLEAYPIPAMLSHGPGDLSVRKLQAHVVEACLSEHFRPDNRSAQQIKRAGRKVRKMHKGSAPELVRVAKRIPDGSSVEVLEWLRGEVSTLTEAITAKTELEEDPSKEEKLKKELEELTHVIDHYVKDNVRDNQGGPKRRLVSTSLSTGVESEVADASFKTFVDPDVDGDHDNTDRYLDITESGSRAERSNLDFQVHRSRGAYVNIARNYVYDPVQWSALTDHSLQGLVRNLMAGVKSGRLVDGVLLMSLLTGRDARTLKDLAPKPFFEKEDSEEDQLVYFKTRASSTRFALWTHVHLPEPTLESEGVFRAPTAGLAIPLPDELSRLLARHTANWSVSEDEINARVSALSTQFAKVTLTRIAQCSYHRLVGQGHSQTHLDRLLGVSLSRSTPQWYEHMDAKRVTGPYEDWVGILNGFLPEQGLTLQVRQSDNSVGSARAPTPEAIAEFFWNLTCFINRRWSSRRLHETHNYYVVYVYQLLSFATGLRPPEDAPFETLKRICFASGKVCLRDKDHSKPSPRWIPLAAIAISQLEIYVKHLKQLRSRLHGDAKDYLDAALRGEVPFLFTLEKGKAIPLQSKHIKQVLEPFWVHDPNWSRHFLRTELIAHGIRDDVVRTFMGHGEMGQEPFAPHSNMSMRRLRTVIPVIEKLATELKIKPREAHYVKKSQL